MSRSRAVGALAAVYLLSLTVSHWVRWRTVEPPRPAGLERVQVETSRAEREPSAVNLSYRAWGNDEGEGGEEEGVAGDAVNSPVVLLLHGSPGSIRDFSKLGPLLGVKHRVLALDLPGFGFSEKNVPEYSIEAHADYAEAFLDRLGIRQAHVVGFSMGGGVALELAGRHGQRVRSVTLLSSIGVQDFELLGNYFLNHAVHGVQLAAVWALHEAVPHFGLLDGFPLNIAYARNFYDTDQRPLRRILEDLEQPVLIIHGEDDFLVPAVAAREHHRLVPQSELLMLDASHFMVFSADERLAGPLDDFIRRVEAGTALTRRDAPRDRLAAAQAPFDPSRIPAAAGITLALLLGLIALATLVSEDTTCIATGLLVSQGRIGLLAGSAACAAGILIGDLLIYAAGRFLGRPALKHAPLKWVLSPRALARGSEWFARRGPTVILSSRFLPGTRVATYFCAGLLKTHFWKFLGYFLLAVSIWTPLLVGLSAWLGGRLSGAFGAFERWALPGAVALAILFSLAWTLARRLSSWSGRRRLLGALRRRLEWEFWPWWLIYAPVYPWIAWLGLRHRSLTLFTAANPGISTGGFVGESKGKILGAIDPRWVARFRRIRADEPAEVRIDQARRFLDRENLPYPVVVKPDVGERGAGFTIVRTPSQLEAAMTALTHDALIQEFIGGVEMGIFYIRRPSEERGRIFSMTRKQLLRLTGDGASTVEQLILRDDRAMRLAPIHLDKMALELEQIPASGTEIPLVEMGVHSRGALFLDGSRFKTPELEDAVDTISRSFEGFFFGRFDLRAPSEDAFRRGEGLKVLELNGVTSEATHIYDPANSFLDAVRVLRGQWALAFEIGAENRDRGVQPTELRTLCRLSFEHLLGRR